MPIFGTLDHERQLPRVPRVEDLATESLELHAVETLTFAAEILQEAGAECVPAALNPVLPAYARLELRRHLDSRWGPFSLACLALAVRADGRAMSYAVGGFCDNDQVMEYLRLHYGARLRRGAISLERRYFGIEGRVAAEGKLALDALMEKPEPGDVSAAAPQPYLHLAKYEGQLWLIQEDRDIVVETCERGQTLIRTFDPEAFGEPRAVFRRPLPAAFVKSSLTCQPVSALFDPALTASVGRRKIERGTA